MDVKLEKYLIENSIKFTLYNHPPLHTVEDSKKIDRKIPGMHCKVLFLKDERDNFYLVGMKAEKRLNFKILNAHFNLKKLIFASEAELHKMLNVRPGSVSIFNIFDKKSNIALVLDKEVWDAELSGFHPNKNTETITLNHEGLEKYFNSLKIKKEIIAF